MIGVSRVSEKGQVTIPKEIRSRLGIRAGDRVLFLVEDGRVVLRKAPSERLSEILRRGKWPESSLNLQRRLREEWRQ